MATCNYVCGLQKQKIIVDFFYIALIMFLSFNIAIINIITTFQNYNIFFTILRSIGS